jgi:hypothetical protein
MKTLQTPSSSASKILFPKTSVSHELVDIATLSVLGWSISPLAAATSFLASAGLSDLGTEIAALTAFP